MTDDSKRIPPMSGGTWEMMAPKEDNVQEALIEAFPAGMDEEDIQDACAERFPGWRYAGVDDEIVNAEGEGYQVVLLIKEDS